MKKIICTEFSVEILANKEIPKKERFRVEKLIKSALREEWRFLRGQGNVEGFSLRVR